MLELHRRCCLHGVSREQVEALIKVDPESVSDLDEMGELPLHCAVRNNQVGAGVIETLCSAYPDAALIVNPFLKELPLLTLLTRCGLVGVRRSEVEALIEANPEAVSTPDARGGLPLHRAVRNNHVREGVIETLCSAYPDAAFVVNPSLKELPLLTRCGMYGVSRGEVEALIDANPEAVSTRDARGELPLHRAVRNNHVGEGVIETLYATINAMEIDAANFRLFLRHAARLYLDQSSPDNLLHLRKQWRSMQQWDQRRHMQCPAPFRGLAFVVLLVLQRNRIPNKSMIMMKLLPFVADVAMLSP